MNILLPILGAIALMVIAALFVKGRDDAKTFDAEIRFVMYKIRNSPVELAYFKHLESEFERINKMARKDREQIHVAWCEFARRFMKFFPKDNGTVNIILASGQEFKATIKNVE